MSKFPYIYYNYKVHIYFIIIWIITTYAAHKTGEKFANNVLVENYIKGEIMRIVKFFNVSNGDMSYIEHNSR